MVEGLETNPAASPASQGADTARRIGRSARSRVFGMFDQRKDELVGQLDRFVQRFRPSGEQDEPTFVDEGIDRVRSFADSIRDKNAEELVEDVRSAAHERPGVFILGALAVGLLAGRVLRDVGVEG